MCYIKNISGLADKDLLHEKNKETLQQPSKIGVPITPIAQKGSLRSREMTKLLFPAGAGPQSHLQHGVWHTEAPTNSSVQSQLVGLCAPPTSLHESDGRVPC